jgi:hypothetical protein
LVIFNYILPVLQKNREKNKIKKYLRNVFLVDMHKYKQYKNKDR